MNGKKIVLWIIIAIMAIASVYVAVTNQVAYSEDYAINYTQETETVS